jgi:hypothetical protein
MIWDAEEAKEKNGACGLRSVLASSRAVGGKQFNAARERHGTIGRQRAGGAFPDTHSESVLALLQLSRASIP